MRPYRNKLEWNLKGRPYHLIDGLMPAAQQLHGEVYDAFLVRAAMMRRTLRIALALLILLYVGVVASAITLIVPYFAAAETLVDILQSAARITGSISLILLGAYLLLRRRVAQLEADLVVLCITNR